MGMQQAFKISAAGLSAQRTRMEAVASNMANVNTTRTEEGGPYRRRLPVFSTQNVSRASGVTRGEKLSSVRVDRMILDDSPFPLRFEPGHPDANAEGYVAYPNINPIEEMVDMLSAARSYEANVTVVKSLRDMGANALQIIA